MLQSIFTECRSDEIAITIAFLCYSLLGFAFIGQALTYKHIVCSLVSRLKFCTSDSQLYKGTLKFVTLDGMMSGRQVIGDLLYSK